METRRIGSLQVSSVGLGCNNFGGRLDERTSTVVVHAALDSGITFFDTADVYGDARSESYLGRALGPRRPEVVIATKFGMALDGTRRGAHPDYVRRAAEDSLRRLGTDHIDLYQLHQPDPDVPIADTLGALAALVAEGKVREIGCSNFSAGQLRAAAAAVSAGSPPFVSVQNEYSLMHRDPETGVLAECERLHLGFLPYFPLASGLLSGKYRRGRPHPQKTRLPGSKRGERFLSSPYLDLVEALIAFAQSKGHTLLELAFSWLLSRSVVSSVIAGAMTEEQVRANARAAKWTLTDADLADVDAILGVP
jgi:aryl-alcohol dehydrogenase-like predicted oxidoreductase